MKKYTTFEQAARDGQPAVYVVDESTEYKTRVRFLHLRADGTISSEGGYKEDYDKDQNGVWWYCHCGFGKGCFYTDPEVSSNPFVDCLAGDIIGYND
jgi:hypothetical protein